ncbi:MAG: hypothetical protein ACRD0D_11980 [Acidimicrobiales bacterium]
MTPTLTVVDDRAAPAPGCGCCKPPPAPSPAAEVRELRARRRAVERRLARLSRPLP